MSIHELEVNLQQVVDTLKLIGEASLRIDSAGDCSLTVGGATVCAHLSIDECAVAMHLGT